MWPASARQTLLSTPRCGPHGLDLAGNRRRRDDTRARGVRGDGRRASTPVITPDDRREVFDVPRTNGFDGGKTAHMSTSSRSTLRSSRSTRGRGTDHPRWAGPAAFGEAGATTRGRDRTGFDPPIRWSSKRNAVAQPSTRRRRGLHRRVQARIYAALGASVTYRVQTGPPLRLHDPWACCFRGCGRTSPRSSVRRTGPSGCASGEEEWRRMKPGGVARQNGVPLTK